MSVASTGSSGAKRAYPHVDGIEDWRAQQTIRLLWERVFNLEGRLQAIEATVGDLVSRADSHEDQLTRLAGKIDEALALAQLARSEQGGDGFGESTIPDYSSIANSVLARYNPIVPIAEVEAGKAQLTRAIAWEIYNTVDTNIGLLEKTSGNQINGRSTDLVIQMTDGSFADVASGNDNEDGTVTITASWGAHAPDANTSDEARWIVPTAAIAAESGPMTLV